MAEFKKREIAYKIRIGDLLKGNQIFDETPQNPETTNKRLLHLELGDKKLIRVNLISNVIEKYESEGEKRFASITLDDGSGQIRARLFGEDIKKFQELNQGDTIIIIGLLRSYNQELYILPEVLRKQDPRYLLIRKLEIEKAYIKKEVPKEEIKVLKNQLIEKIKAAETNQGIEIEQLILELKTTPGLVNQEIKKLLEEGIIYEPKPGRLRYLG